MSLARFSSMARPASLLRFTISVFCRVQIKAIAVVRQTRQSERLSLPGAANPTQDGNRGGISCPQDLWHFFLFIEFLSNLFSTLTKKVVSLVPGSRFSQLFPGKN